MYIYMTFRTFLTLLISDIVRFNYLEKWMQFLKQTKVDFIKVASIGQYILADHIVEVHLMQDNYVDGGFRGGEGI